MSTKNSIEQRAVQAADQALSRQQYVSPIDVLVGMGWLQFVHVLDWQKGRIPYLERVVQGNLSKISLAMKCLRDWAKSKGLKPSETAYLAKTRGPKQDLQFSASGDPDIEKAYRMHYVSPCLSEKKQQKLKEKAEQAPELVVFSLLTKAQCVQCKKDLVQGDRLFLDKDQPLCLDCAGFGALVFLPRGDARLTRRTKKYSTQALVVLRYSRARKQYERQGLLVDADALEKAQEAFGNE